MAKDYLNVIERALMMGVSDKINAAVTGDVFVHGQFPETEDLKFPSIVIQQVASGFEEKFQGEKITFGTDATSSSGEIYGMSFLFHIVVDKDTTIGIDGGVYQRYLQDHERGFGDISDTKYGRDENLNLPGGTNPKEILVQ